jgi:hypothetical protein
MVVFSVTVIRNALICEWCCQEHNITSEADGFVLNLMQDIFGRGLRVTLGSVHIADWLAGHDIGRIVRSPDLFSPRRKRHRNASRRDYQHCHDNNRTCDHPHALSP